MAEASASEPNQRPDSTPPRRPVYQVETTGSFWSDLWEGTKRLSPADFEHIGEMPCTRTALMSGIASGVGIGVIRGLSVHPWIAGNWAFGTFFVVAAATREICQMNMRAERHRVQSIIEKMPNRFVKPAEPATENTPKPS